MSQTSHLDAELRRLVDEQLAASGLENLSLRKAECVIKRCACDADRAAYVARGRTARADRRVSLRPAPDTMSVLSGFLPVEQGVACLAALRGQRRLGARRRGHPSTPCSIRHLDHVDRHRAGGPTSFADGRGTCARGNHVHDGLGTRPHAVRTTTPTGHTYLSGAGPAP